MPFKSRTTNKNINTAFNKNMNPLKPVNSTTTFFAGKEPETSTHPDKCIGNVTEPANPTCANTTHKFSHCDCKEPVSLDPAPEFTHEGNTDAKFKQLHEVASIIVEYIEDPDRRSYYRSQIQQLTPTTEETSEKDTSTETCPSQKDTEWRELGPDEVIQEGDETRWKGQPQYKPVIDEMIGADASCYKFLRFRTRRPSPKQGEMPLDADIASIEWSCVHTARAIRYLRDEIQKLKQK